MGGGVAESVGPESCDARSFGTSAQRAVEGVGHEAAPTIAEPELLAVRMRVQSAAAR
jgi:hypothetical protein